MAQPDLSQAHPTATGLALQTVKEHSEPRDIQAYFAWWCPFSQRVWVALEAKQIPYQYIEENPHRKSKEFEKISPKGQTPVLVVKGKPIVDSKVILQFLEDEYPNTKKLLPKDPTKADEARQMVDYVDKNVLPAYFNLVMSKEEDGQKKALEELNSALEHFSKDLVGPYWAGEDLSWADLALMPWMGRSEFIKTHRNFDENKVNQKFADWFKNILANESVKKTRSDMSRYTQLYFDILSNN